MEQIELLWEYQSADLAADKYESSMKRSPTRVALKKNRDFLMEQQNNVKRMEEEVSDMLDRFDVIKAATLRLKEQIDTLAHRTEANPPKNLTEAEALEKEAQKLVRDLEDYEREIKRIQKDTADRERQEKDIRVKYAKTKAEYDQQKVAYDAELKEQTKVLEEKRAIASEKQKAIDPALLEKYMTIKKHVIPAMAKLYSGQCSGCNMNLPQVSLRKFKSDTPYIECENCGRMIIQ